MEILKQMTAWQYAQITMGIIWIFTGISMIVLGTMELIEARKAARMEAVNA